MSLLLHVRSQKYLSDTYDWESCGRWERLLGLVALIRQPPPPRPTFQCLFAFRHPSFSNQTSQLILNITSLAITMAVEEPRRSGRVRKPVKSYADEQNEEKHVALAAPSKGKRKRKAADDADDEADEVPKPTKKASKKSAEKDKTFKPEPAELENESSTKGGKKLLPVQIRKPKKYKVPTVPETWFEDASRKRIATNKRSIKALAPGQEETRLQRQVSHPLPPYAVLTPCSYVDEPAQSYHNAMKKINKERMFVLDRERGVEEDCHALHADCPCENVQMAGTSCVALA